MLCAANKNRTLAAWTIRLGRSPCPSDRPYGFTLGSAFPGLKNKRRERERARAPLLINSLLCSKKFLFLVRREKKNHLPFNGVSDLFRKPPKRLSLSIWRSVLFGINEKSVRRAIHGGPTGKVNFAFCKVEGWAPACG